MRPVNKPANNPNYNPPANLTFASTNAAILQKLAGNLPPYYYNWTVTLGYALNLLLNNVKGTPFPNITLDEKKKLITAIWSQVTDIYKTASAPLTQDLGDYCSYCGTALPGLIEVEHCVPKSQYPTYATDWVNFLLCCGPCNTSKGDKPSRVTAQPWTGQPAPTEQQYYTAIRNNHYEWPDLNSTCWNDLPTGMKFLNPTDGNWYTLSNQESVNANNKLTGYDVVNHRVYANVMYQGVMRNNVQVAVLVFTNNTHGMGVRAREMIDQMQFNNDVTNPLTGTYDRRVMNRTRAWFYALEKLKLLQTATTQAEFNLLWPQVPMMGAVSGFYGVWLDVLEGFNDFSGNPYDARFVADTNVPLYYPNTDTTNLP